MRQNPHVRICGGPGSATTLVYPTARRSSDDDHVGRGTRGQDALQGIRLAEGIGSSRAAVPDAERHASRKTPVPQVHEVGLEPKRHALGEMEVNPAARLKGESLFDINSRNVRRYVRGELLVYPEDHRARQKLHERRDAPTGPGIPDAGQPDVPVACVAVGVATVPEVVLELVRDRHLVGTVLIDRHEPPRDHVRIFPINGPEGLRAAGDIGDRLPGLGPGKRRRPEQQDGGASGDPRFSGSMAARSSTDGTGAGIPGAPAGLIPHA